MGGTRQERFRLSRHADLVDLGARWVIASGVHLQRVVLDGSLGAVRRRLAYGSFTQDELAAACPPGVDAGRLLAFLRARELVVPEEFDEEAAVRARLASLDDADAAGAPAAPRWPPPTHYWSPQALSPDHFREQPAGEERPPMRVLLVGGCVLQFLEDELVRAALERGFDAQVRHEWPPLSEPAVKSVERFDPHLVVFQPTVHPLMTALWDEGALVEPAERERRLRHLEEALATSIGHLMEAIGHRLAVIHNFAPPAVSPFGRIDFRTPVNFRHVVADANRRVDEIAAGYENAMVLDEERLAAMHGSAALFDDLVFPFGHHGGAPDLERDDLSQRRFVSRVLADEYLDCFELHHGPERIKCIVTDLDGTLWPGIAAETGFAWLEGDSTARWTALGLHQALKLMKSRGILLAACSKGTEEVTLAAWRRARHPLMLDPSDFVDLRIDWRPKSSNLAELCEALALAPERVLFLDDSAVERAEVRAHVPRVRVPEVEVHEMRRYLLTSPHCEVPRITAESRTRTDTTRAVLARRSIEPGTDMASFLRDLEIELTVRHGERADAARIAELLNRTSQFTTTRLRLTEAEVGSLLESPDADVLVMSVRDRLADYGTAGACVIEGDAVTALAVSCRVIGLDVALPFLVTCLRRTGRDRAAVRGLLVETPANAPARDIFLRAGFDPSGAGEFTLTAPDRLPAPEAFVQRVLSDERADPVGSQAAGAGR